MHGRDCLPGMKTQPAQCHGGTQSIEQSLDLHCAVVGKMRAPLAFTEMQIVPRNCSRSCCFLCQHQRFVAKLRATAIDIGRSQPLDHDGIALEHEAQRLAEIPAVDIEIALDREFDYIARRIERQIVITPAHIDEAAIVIAVRRWKSPGAAAALDREQHARIVVARDRFEPSVDGGDDSGIKGGVEIAQRSHDCA